MFAQASRDRNGRYCRTYQAILVLSRGMQKNVPALSPRAYREMLQVQHECIIDVEDCMDVATHSLDSAPQNATLIVGPSGRVRTWFRRHFETAECLRYLLEHEAQIGSRKYGESACGPGQRERVAWIGLLEAMALSFTMVLGIVGKEKRKALRT